MEVLKARKYKPVAGKAREKLLVLDAQEFERRFDDAKEQDILFVLDATEMFPACQNMKMSLDI